MTSDQWGVKAAGQGSMEEGKCGSDQSSLKAVGRMEDGEGRKDGWLSKSPIARITRIEVA